MTNERFFEIKKMIADIKDFENFKSNMSDELIQEINEYNNIIKEEKYENGNIKNKNFSEIKFGKKYTYDNEGVIIYDFTYGCEYYKVNDKVYRDREDYIISNREQKLLNLGII